MSNRPKIKPVRSHRARREPGEGEAYCTQIAVVADRHVQADVDEARQTSHDRLIDVLGALRRSGVWWTEYPARTGLAVLDDVMPADGTERVREVRERSVAMLQAPESLLVVAWVIATVPEGVTF